MTEFGLGLKMPLQTDRAVNLQCVIAEGETSWWVICCRYLHRLWTTEASRRERW